MRSSPLVAMEHLQDFTNFTKNMEFLPFASPEQSTMTWPEQITQLVIDTATNTAVEAIDRIRDTALSHNRLFFIEVMGRHSGYIAINSGIAGGAAAVIIPEENISFDELYALLGEGGKTNKKSNLVVVAEGSKIGDAHSLAKQVAERSDYFDIKVTVLGHLQRGGAPTYFDRVLAIANGRRCS